MKRISKKEFLKKDVYIMYRSKEEYKDILKFIEDNFKSARWFVGGKPTKFDYNEYVNRHNYSGFININMGNVQFIHDFDYLQLDDENKLVLSYSEFIEFVKLFTELLSEYEKKYITGMIKASGVDIDYVIKKNPESSNDYLCISIDSDGANVLCLYDAACTFEGLDEGEKYTLDELGITIHDEQPGHKITLTEFWNSKTIIAIHCDTEWKAIKLLEAFDKLGKKWYNGISYLNSNLYSTWGQNPCYLNNHTYCSYDFCKEHNKTIYEFDEVDLNN